MLFKRTLIVGDIHGCLDMLKRLMDKVQWDPEKDRLIFVGDYIDRGDDPKGVVQYIIDLKRLSDHVRCVLGNHENLFLDFLRGGDIRLVLQNGGMPTIQGYEIEKSKKGDLIIPEEHMTFFESLELWIELEDYYVVHAGFRPGVEIEYQSIDDMIWIRDTFINSDYDFGKRIIFGHTPFNEPLIVENKIGIDTGAVYGNRLTCLEIPSMKFYSVGV